MWARGETPGIVVSKACVYYTVMPGSLSVVLLVVAKVPSVGFDGGGAQGKGQVVWSGTQGK